MELSDAAPFLASNFRGVLMTLRPDGRPQASNIVYAYADGMVRISVPSNTVKARNIARDGRVSLHVTSGDFGRFVVADGEARLSPASSMSGDETGQELLEIYEIIRKEPHPDRQEFFDVMARDRRLVIRLRIDHVYGRV